MSGRNPFENENDESVRDFHKRVNRRYDEMFYECPNGERVPFVCAICDEFIITRSNQRLVSYKGMKKMREVLAWENFPDLRRGRDLEEYFRFDISKSCVDSRTDFSFLDGMALSPRAVILKGSSKTKFNFVVCKRCHGCCAKVKIPRHAILNANYVGGAPACLVELTEVERAFLTPVKGYGFCFTWVGGKQRNLKGTMTFMRVEKRGISKQVVMLEKMGFNDHVLCLYTGHMTSRQRSRAKEKSSVRTFKIFRALDFLVTHNPRWCDVDLQEIRDSFEEKKPVVFDRSQEQESVNSNVEEEEIFTCYFPDGAATPTNGGFERPECFKTYVEDMAKNGFDVEFEANLQKTFVTAGDSDILMDACLLQFPYGIGHMREDRLMHDGSRTDKCDLVEYLQHLSRLSQPVFQTNFFQLVLYSLCCKSWLLKSSRLSLRGKTDAENLAQNLNARDVNSCINGRRLGNRAGGTQASNALLKAVDATARNLPHTNEATGRARGNNEAMQHHFGMSSFFVTATFDDENSFLIQVYSGEIIDDENPVDSLSDKELCERASKRRDLRIKYPGIACMNFEALLEILMEEVVGWDMEMNMPTEHEGFFGRPEGVSFSVEEQGRKTNHVHMSVWVRKVKAMQNTMFFGNQRERKAAGRAMQSVSERVCSTEMFLGDHTVFRRAWDHACSVPKSDRDIPTVVNDQALRNLRNRNGYKDSKGLFAFCRHCDKVWTYEELLNQYIRSEVLTCPRVEDGAGNFDNPEQLPKARMMAKIVEYQKAKGSIDPPKQCITATYQHHLSCHVKNCFKCQKKGRKKRGHICGPDCECRYRLPDRKRRRAELFVEQKAVKWYLWSGDSREQPLMQVCPKRSQYDLFQNVACDAISFSKLSCNNNVSMVVDGPIGAYQMKYQDKNTKEDDTAEYSEVMDEVKKFAGDRKYDLDRREALRRVCRASFAHNRRNVVSASLAAFLLRRGTRFYCSHEFAYCPLKDLVRIHNKEDVKGTLKYQPNGECFFENYALHYLCRHEELEDLSLRQFIEGFKIVYISPKDEDSLPFMADSGHYQHPSRIKQGARKGQCSQGTNDRDTLAHIRVSQWMFPDTAAFKGNIMECPESDINNKMEEYAQLVLTLFYPHRHVRDLKALGGGRFPYVQKLREVYQCDCASKERGDYVSLFTEENVTFLQNLQNARSNSLRYKMSGDPLKNCTEPYMSPNPQESDTSTDKDDEEEVEETAYEMFLQHLETEFSAAPVTDEDPDFLNETLQDFTFRKMRNKGRDNCGYDIEIEPETLAEDVSDFVLFRSHNGSSNTNNDCADYYDERKTYTCKDIVQLHLRRNLPKMKKEVWKDKEVEVTKATGSIKSIREWEKACLGGDKMQERAFEVLISAFLLTFYEEKPEDVNDPTTETSPVRSKYRRMMKALQKLRGIGKAYNLICLLHGAGGSGKSTVINLVKAYAADYCEALGHKFTNRTIIVTAMSGVAATLLNGETTHSVLGLNRDTVQNEEAADWCDARLLIIDECSFAAQQDFEKMHEHLKCFMQEHHYLYGGLNIVFAGDYSQLEPVNREPIYKDDNYCAEFHGALNCFIELDGKWRFLKDPHYGDIMKRFREGNPTLEDIDEINDKCLTEFKSPPPGTQVATYTNKDRDAINAAVFHNWTKANKPNDGTVLKGACIIFMDDLYMNDGSKTFVPVTSNLVRRHFYENSTESDCNFGSNGRGRVDPCLKLYPDAPMMLTKNSDVAKGEANGSRVFAKQVLLKGGESPFVIRLDNGAKIQACYASQVQSLLLEHENDNISPRQFELGAQTFNFKCRMNVGDEELYVAVKGTQFPLISNSCTTGHKLQGCTVTSILANTWFYGANWAYVVLSRVKTMNGLYLRVKLSKDLRKYEKPESMKNMLDKFKSTIAVKLLEKEDYDDMEKINIDWEMATGNINNNRNDTDVAVPY